MKKLLYISMLCAFMITGCSDDADKDVARDVWVGSQSYILPENNQESWTSALIDIYKLPQTETPLGDSICFFKRGPQSVVCNYELSLYTAEARLDVNSVTQGDSIFKKYKEIELQFEAGEYTQKIFDVQVLADGIYASYDGETTKVTELKDYKKRILIPTDEVSAHKYSTTNNISMRSERHPIHFIDSLYEFTVDLSDNGCVLYQLRPEHDTIELDRP